MTKNVDIRWKQRLQNFEQAFSEFDDACSRKTYSKLERSGLIQTFEFTFELAWKTLQDFLGQRGYINIIGPRPVIEQAFRDGLIHEGETWMKMLESRNLTVHSYDESTAERIATEIRSRYHPLLKDLVKTLKAAPTA